MKTRSLICSVITGLLLFPAVAPGQFTRVDSNGVIQYPTNFWEANSRSNLTSLIASGVRTNPASSTLLGLLSAADWISFNSRQGGSQVLSNWSNIDTNAVATTNYGGILSQSNAANAWAGNSLTTSNLNVAGNPIFNWTTNLIAFYGAGNASNNVTHVWDATLGVYTN